MFNKFFWAVDIVWMCVSSAANLKNSTHPDEITSLPGLNFPIDFKHYSGYLNGNDGNQLHYWFVESQTDPSSAPLLLWLNGGPGCSSLLGLLGELGPFHVKPDGKTVYNNTYSWNTFANILFLETPAGVGFSYTITNNTATDDEKAVAKNYAALKSFYKKFPQFRSNDLYLSGESYAGVYIPTLALRIMERQQRYPMQLRVAFKDWD